MTMESVGQSSALIKAIFWLLGVGILLPWNAFISAKPYFDSRLCSEASQQQTNVELLFGFLYNFSSVMSLGGLIGFQWRRDNDRRRVPDNTRAGILRDDEHQSSTQSWWMVMFPLYVYLAVFLLTTAVVLMTDLTPFSFLSFTLLSLSICGVCTAFASAGIVATAGLFPSEYGTTHSYFSGQALGGLAVALANLMAAVLRDPSSFRQEHCGGERQRLLSEDMTTCVPYHAVDWSSFSYFLVGTVVLGMCIVGYRHVEQCKRSILRARYEALNAPQENVHAVKATEGRSDLLTRHGSIEMLHHEEGADENGLDETDEQSTTQDTSEERASKFVWNAIKGPAFAIFFTFVVTLALFPGWTSELKSVEECQSGRRIHNDLYTSITFVTFNAGDFAGRLLSAKVIQNHPSRSLSRTLVIVSLCRCVFFPLFCLCLARDSVFDSIAISSDLFSFVVQALFAILNGIVVAVSFAHAPTLLPATQEMQTKASEMLNFALSFGLLSGSMLALPFSKVATGHW